MAGESILVRSAAYAQVQAAASVANGAFSGGARTNVGAALAATNEENYPLLDLKLLVSVGTPVENGKVLVYRIPGDGTHQAPVPAGNYRQHFVGSFVLDDAGSSAFFLYGVPNVDNNDEFMLRNENGVTLTLQLLVRGRTLKAAT